MMMNIFFKRNKSVECSSTVVTRECDALPILRDVGVLLFQTVIRGVSPSFARRGRRELVDERNLYSFHFPKKRSQSDGAKTGKVLTHSGRSSSSFSSSSSSSYTTMDSLTCQTLTAPPQKFFSVKNEYFESITVRLSLAYRI